MSWILAAAFVVAAPAPDRRVPVLIEGRAGPKSAQVQIVFGADASDVVVHFSGAGLIVAKAQRAVRAGAFRAGQRLPLEVVYKAKKLPATLDVDVTSTSNGARATATGHLPVAKSR